MKTLPDLRKVWVGSLALILAIPTALSQITLVPPFVGDHSETWEEFGTRFLPPEGTSILGGIATISGTDMQTAKSFTMCTVIGKPSDGAILMDSDRPAGPFVITFSEPVSAFGAYWGDGYRCDLCCFFGDAPIILTFRDVDGNVIGTDSFDYRGDGTLMWRGYRFDIPVKTITRTAGDGLEGFAVDGLQAVVAATGSGSARLYNISTRGFVQTGDNVLIGGLIISGTGQQQVLLRALGPTLGQAPFNVPNVLTDPVLELHLPDGSVITNDNWQQAANASAIPVALQPPTANEAAILVSLAPANYTAIVRGANNSAGNALFEAYDLGTDSTSGFANLSTRGFVGTGDSIMIAGLIVQGPGSNHLLLRALGPTLGQPPFNVPAALADPFLDLRDGNGNPVMTNDNWQETQAVQIQATGRAPAFLSESAIVVTLLSGNYTAIVTGVSDSTGNALVEVYTLD